MTSGYILCPASIPVACRQHSLAGCGQSDGGHQIPKGGGRRKEPSNLCLVAYLLLTPNMKEDHMKKTTLIIITAACLVFFSTYPAPAADGRKFHRDFLYQDKVKVMTRNLYLGADVFKVLAAARNPDPSLGGLDVPHAVAKLFQTVQDTDFPERAEAIANEIWLKFPIPPLTS
jgi:hypothetical protein